MTVGREDGHVCGDVPDLIDASFEVAVASPGPEDQLVVADDLVPAMLQLAVGDDVVGVRGEALGIGPRILVESPIVV
ncbi:hypothetical protein GCM10025862_32730 [Arsenicicoccus piscis]|uniref:Uncharacterized protein n=1 Tax=Arsenicicoccus piscis TaxID=673954 RepID=A0ABQ6HSB6_9MICO|nr:hypothetical protein GCM10025862_32730 [Arsenicicoccus piscis]